MSKKEHVIAFKRIVRAYHRRAGRHDLPWRGTHDPYRIAVSELMLQQTQVPRVIEKYTQFLRLFPTAKALANAPLSRVLAAWSGLGYNRRAKFLHAMAKEIVTAHRGIFPNTVEALVALPGIGPYTARAIAAFAYNQPVAFIETNIRTAFMHHFFPRKQRVSDKELMPLIEAALDRKNPREWYSALMDYGTHLKQSGVKVHRNSAQYKKQSAFKGSGREVRGAIIRSLVERPKTIAQLARQTAFSTDRIKTALAALRSEKLIAKQGAYYALAEA